MWSQKPNAWLFSLKRCYYRTFRPFPCLAVGSLRSLSVSSCAFSAVWGSLLRLQAAPQRNNTHTLRICCRVFSPRPICEFWIQTRSWIHPAPKWVDYHKTIFVAVVVGKVRRDVAAPLCEGHGAFFERNRGFWCRRCTFSKGNVTVCRFSWSHWGGPEPRCSRWKCDVIHQRSALTLMV